MPLLICEDDALIAMDLQDEAARRTMGAIVSTEYSSTPPPGDCFTGASPYILPLHEKWQSASMCVPV